MLTAAIIASIATVSIAQPADLAPSDSPDVRITFSPSATYTTETSLADEPGDFSLATAGADLSITFFPTNDITMIAALEHETAFYDFSDTTTLIPGTDDPFDTAFSQSLSLTAIFKQDNITSLLITGAVNNAFVSGADANDAFTYQLAAGAQFKVSDKVTLALGGGFRTRLENNTIAIPLINLRWQIDEHTRLTAQGLSLKLAHDLDSANTIHLRSAFEIREYRLDDDIPSARNGSFEHTRVPLALGWTHAPSDSFSISFEAGAILWQELEVRTGSGNRIAEYDADPSLFLALTADFRF